MTGLDPEKLLVALICSFVFSGELQAADDARREFIFAEKSASLQKYGYQLICRKPDLFSCGIPYRKLAGKTGFFVNMNSPISDSGLTFYEIAVEGKRFYIHGLPNSDDPFGLQLNGIRWKDELESDLSLIGKPVVSGSPVVVASIVQERGDIRIAGVTEPFQKREWPVVKRILESQPPEFHQEILELLGNAVIDYDEFDEVATIRPAPYVYSKANEDSVILLSLIWDGDTSRLIEEVRYQGEGWIFAKRYIVKAGTTRYESPRREFRRDHAGGDVWEWTILAVDAEQEKLLQAITQAEDSKIRFYGKQYYHDEKLGRTTREQIGIMLRLHELLNTGPSP